FEIPPLAEGGEAMNALRRRSFATLSLRKARPSTNGLKFFILALALSGRAFAQQPQSYYKPTAGSGLTLNIASGTWFCGASAVSYAAGTLTMSASTTNYVYMDKAP